MRTQFLVVSLTMSSCSTVGVTKCPLPRMVDKKVTRPQYADPLRDPAADLIPMTVWDAVRLFEHTLTYAKRILDLDLLPPDTKSKRTFLWRYGYQKQIMGVSVRPVLTCQQTHALMMKRAVRGGQLQMFQPFDNNLPVWRTLEDADSISHVERAKTWCCLYNGRARGWWLVLVTSHC